MLCPNRADRFIAGELTALGLRKRFIQRRVFLSGQSKKRPAHFK